jgi:hypothetical protein
MKRTQRLMATMILAAVAMVGTPQAFAGIMLGDANTRGGHDRSGIMLGDRSGIMLGDISGIMLGDVAGIMLGD